MLDVAVQWLDLAQQAELLTKDANDA